MFHLPLKEHRFNRACASCVLRQAQQFAKRAAQNRDIYIYIYIYIGITYMCVCVCVCVYIYIYILYIGGQKNWVNGLYGGGPARLGGL